MYILLAVKEVKMVVGTTGNGYGICGGTEGLEFEIDLNQEEENCGIEKFKVHNKTEFFGLETFSYDPVYSWQGKNLSTLV